MKKNNKKILIIVFSVIGGCILLTFATIMFIITMKNMSFFAKKSNNHFDTEEKVEQDNYDIDYDDDYINDARNSAKQRIAELIAKEAELAYTSYLFNNGASGKPADFCEYMTDEYFDMDSAELNATGCNDASKAEVKVTGDNNVEYTVKYAGGTITVSATGLEDVTTKLASK